MCASPAPTQFRTTSRRAWLLGAISLAVATAVLAWATSSYWVPYLEQGLVGASLSRGAPSPDENGHEHHKSGHANHEDVRHKPRHHEHEHAGTHEHDQHNDDHSHSDETAIELSDNALKNIGYQPVTVELGDFQRSIAIPAVVVTQPGRSQIHITAPMTGRVTEVHVVQGQALEPDSPMFEVRLTHEELVTVQQEYLKTVESLDVVNREIARLESLGEGVVAGRRILEQKYEKQKLEATLRAAGQALLLHGLTDEQIQEVLTTRRLISALTIRAPAHSHGTQSCGGDHLFHVQSLPVSPGEQVQAGQDLAVLADHCELLAEGLAFESDAEQLRAAMSQGWSVTARLLNPHRENEPETIEGLAIHYLADQIDPESRVFRFYVRLPNEVVHEQQGPNARRFIEWRFKPGQRMELIVPVEVWTDQIVLPIDAVVEEAGEAYVYRHKDDHFDRVSVHVVYRDRDSAVVANNGAVIPGDVVAGRGAFQMHLALKNKSGGGVDPHAGHSH